MVSEIFNMPEPSNELDVDIKVTSDTDDDLSYMVNLYDLTCQCKDYDLTHRVLYSKGDMRRMCKHLLGAYRRQCGLDGLNDFQKFIIETGRTLNKNYYEIKVDGMVDNVLVGYNDVDGWWNLYTKRANGKFEHFGYHPLSDRFAYGEGPKGYIHTIKAQLAIMKRNLGIRESETKKPMPFMPIVVAPKKEENIDYKGGCFAEIIFWGFIFTVLYLIIR